MMKALKTIITILAILTITACTQPSQPTQEKTIENPKFKTITVNNSQEDPTKTMKTYKIKEDTPDLHKKWKKHQEKQIQQEKREALVEDNKDHTSTEEKISKS